MAAAKEPKKPAAKKPAAKEPAAKEPAKIREPPRVTLKQVEEAKKSKPLWIKAFSQVSPEYEDSSKTYATWGGFVADNSAHYPRYPIMHAAIYPLDGDDNPLQPWIEVTWMIKNRLVTDVIEIAEKTTAYDAALKAYVAETWKVFRFAPNDEESS